MSVVIGKFTAVSLPPVLKGLALVATPLATFFSSPVLLGLAFMLLMDFTSGIYKAKLLRRVCSTRFGDVFNRAVYYLVVFSTLHLLSTFSVSPYQSAISCFEGFVLSGYLFKEAISVLENLKAIQVAKGIADPILDGVIGRIGLDLDRILRDCKPQQVTDVGKPSEGTHA